MIPAIFPIRNILDAARLVFPTKLIVWTFRGVPVAFRCADRTVVVSAKRSDLRRPGWFSAHKLKELLNRIDGGTPEAKENRVDLEQFNRELSLIFSPLDQTIPRHVVDLISGCE